MPGDSPYEDDSDGRHLTPVYRIVLVEGYGFISRDKDQPATAVEIDRKLADSEAKFVDARRFLIP